MGVVQLDSKVMLETPVQSIFGLGQWNIWPLFRVCDWQFGMYWEVAPGEERKGERKEKKVRMHTR